MSEQLITAIVALGMLVLLIGLILPATITASKTDASSGFELAAGETVTVTPGLNATVDNVSPNESTVTLIDTDSRLSATQTLQENQSSQYTIADENMTVTIQEIDSNDITRFDVDYSRTYGWGDGAKLFASNLDVVIAILAFLMVIGGLAVVAKL